MFRGSFALTAAAFTIVIFIIIRIIFIRIITSVNKFNAVIRNCGKIIVKYINI